MDFRHGGEDTSSAGNTSHVYAGNGTSPFLPLLLHTDLSAAACPSFMKVSKVAVGLVQMAPGTEGMTRCSVAQAVGGGQNSLLYQCSFYLGKLNCEEDVMGEIV